MLKLNANFLVSVATTSICSPTQTISNTCAAIANTGASGHFFITMAFVSNIDNTAPPNVANGKEITSTATATAEINIPHLP